MGSFRFEGYAIVSADGMLAAADGVMPPSLKIEGDQRFFEAGLDASDLIIHGRNSHEQQPRSAERTRLILTRSVTNPRADTEHPKATLWNPAHASFEDAAVAAGVREGKVAVLGGTDVFSRFLDRYDVFWLSQVPRVRLPGGVPVFHGVPQRPADDILAEHGLRPLGKRLLDREHDVSVVEWRRD